MICKVCGNSENNEEFKIREMMFGFRDEFTYFECSKCGCLQINEIPKNMRKYYPSTYYSFKRNNKSNKFIKSFLKRKRDVYALFKKDFIGKMLCKKYPPNALFEEISKIKVNYNSKILDIGCGAGNFLYSLNEIGFKNLVGIDPYLDEVVGGDIKIYNKNVHELSNNQEYNLIIFNHSFEHIPDQLEILLKVPKILAKNGVCLIRMPIKTDYIWNRYGANWVQIDAPRHFYLHTIKSFKFLVEKSGLKLHDIIFDSTEFQFWGSEQYKQNIPLKAENSYSVNPKNGIFTKEQIVKYKNMAKELNKNDQGDQAAFILKNIGNQSNILL